MGYLKPLGTPGPAPRALQLLLGAELLWLAYSAYSYSGPYRWVAELSLSVFGSYPAKLVFVVALLLLLVPTRLLFARFGGTLGIASPTTSPEENAQLTARNKRIGPGLAFVGGGAVALFLGARDARVAQAGAILAHTSCAKLEAGQRPASTWLEVEGNALQNAGLKTQEGHQDLVYVPLVSEAWSKEKPLPVLLRVDPKKPIHFDSRHFQGGVSPEGVPGMVRVEYERAGLQLQDTLLLVVGKVPSTSLLSSRIIAAAGLLGLLVGGILIKRGWAHRDP